MKKIVPIALLFIVVIALILLLGRDGTDPEAATETAMEDIDDVAEDIPLHTIQATTQMPGVTLQAEAVHTDAPSFLVAHEATSGTPGSVIGVSELLETGITNDVAITLPEPLANGEQVFLMLHTDDGDGQFAETEDDAPTRDSEENIVLILVDVTETPQPANSQSTSTEEVTVSDGADVESDTAETEADTAASVEHLVTYSTQGYEPKELEIVVGETVTWVNNTERGMWTATDVHPTHTIYPAKSETDCLGSSFDACEGTPPGASWSYTFEEVGSWRYHDHLRASQTGVIIVNDE